MRASCFIRCGERSRRAVMLDAYTSTLYEIPFEIARRAQEGALTPDEAARLESVLADRPRLSSPGAPSSPAPLGCLRLIVTNRCNFACRYCFADGGSYGLPPADMAEAVAVRAVDHFFARHPVIREISFFGGEPLLNMGAIRAACRRVRELGKAETTAFSMVTNASLITEEVARELQDLGISIVASVDGPASVHDRQRVLPGGRATFAAVDAGTIREDGLQARGLIRRERALLGPPRDLEGGAILFVTRRFQGCAGAPRGSRRE